MPDILGVTASVAMIAVYYVFLWFKVRTNSMYTIHRVNELARRLWVANVMKSPAKDVMAVQTLRNFLMGASLMASTAALLLIGTLTLSGQSDNIARNWHVLNGGGAQSTDLWTVKVLLLLVDFITAFFAFARAVRLANHVVFMMNVPDHNAHSEFSPDRVGDRLNRAGGYFAVGMRAFFMAIPLVFWLFGPVLLVVASCALVVILFHLDRSPAA